MPDLSKATAGWYCFKALPKKEHIAAELLRRIPEIETFCPRISYIKKTRRGKVKFVECLFPGYVFVQTDLRQTYRLIRATQGIRDVVAFGERVPLIPAAFIEELRQRLDEEQVRALPEPEIKPGQTVTITEGPFRNLQAIVSGQLDQRQRVALLLDFLGRQMEVSMPVDDLIVETEEPKGRLWED
ncbi:MAG TPA: transcription termination/antitermination NusG family protein [Oceanipulchritudo sp.]|nr:transcription termination/antitermination NusG family protein [Oceanipulchritudo sp.]